jgi:DNA-binding NarL/FixJ family response regulator
MMPGPVQRIMIAEDHCAVRRGVRALVETRPGFVVVAEAANGHEAFEEARRTRPDIAILDYSLPELNGLDLTVALKRELPGVQILIYTIHDNGEIISGVLRAGARGYVTKSDTEQHLLGALDALAAGRPYFTGTGSEALLRCFIETKGHLELGGLTHRERDIIQLVAEGQTNKNVATTLGIKVKTVDTHRGNAMHKLKLRTVADLVRYAIRNNMVEA